MQLRHIPDANAFKGPLPFPSGQKKIAVLGSNDTTKLAAAAGHLSLLDVVLDIFVSARL